MGEMADYYIELGLNQGWSPFGGSSRRHRGDEHCVVCRKCGAIGLKWRATEQGWRLFEDKRGERNQKLEHQCGAVTASDFEALE